MHGDRPTSYWEAMTVMMSKIKIMAIACAWIQRGVSYFVTTCGITEMHEDKSLANFEDEFGNATCEEMNRP